MQVLTVDTHPVTVRDRDVEPIALRDVPSELREAAATALGSLSGDEWWTVGEFLDDGETLSDTLVARRVLVGGRMAIQYGVEC